MNVFSRRARRRAVLLLIPALVCGGCSRYRQWRARPRPPYHKLTPPVAYEMMRDSPGMLVLDLRTPQQFNGRSGHIRQARNIPLARLPYRILEIITFREDTILIYCEANECADKATSILAASGFESIVLMDGGIDQWIRKGFKTVLPANIAGQAEEDREHLMPVRPGEKKNDPTREVPVKPPPPPPAPSPPPPSPPPPSPPPPGLSGVAAPRQIG